MSRKLYTVAAIQTLFDFYTERGGEIIQVDCGGVGLGTVICIADGLKSAVIQEVYLNEWSSGHTVTLYKTLPKKYIKLMEEIQPC
jgi:hypothetical protein